MDTAVRFANTTEAPNSAVVGTKAITDDADLLPGGMYFDLNPKDCMDAVVFRWCHSTFNIDRFC